MYGRRLHYIIIGLLIIGIFGIPLLNAYAQESNSLSEDFSFRRWLALAFIEGEPAPKAVGVDYLLAATGIPESKFATLEGAPKVVDEGELLAEDIREGIRSIGEITGEGAREEVLDKIFERFCIGK